MSLSSSATASGERRACSPKSSCKQRSVETFILSSSTRGCHHGPRTGEAFREERPPEYEYYRDACINTRYAHANRWAKRPSHRDQPFLAFPTMTTCYFEPCGARQNAAVEIMQTMRRSKTRSEAARKSCMTY